jgi:hypothetical protein
MFVSQIYRRADAASRSPANGSGKSTSTSSGPSSTSPRTWHQPTSCDQLRQRMERPAPAARPRARPARPGARPGAPIAGRPRRVRRPRRRRTNPPHRPPSWPSVTPSGSDRDKPPSGRTPQTASRRRAGSRLLDRPTVPAASPHPEGRGVHRGSSSYPAGARGASPRRPVTGRDCSGSSHHARVQQAGSTDSRVLGCSVMTGTYRA